MIQRLTAIIEKEDDGYVSLCPELDIASQGASIEEARDNLKEALELFFETASPEETKQRLHGDIFVTQVEVVSSAKPRDNFASAFVTGL
ncbi:MAG: type II toxin-antitoxin system HicB family antitoxin [Nitrospiraceae bacterium]|nr:type II toxin-antitoxin system HicB family antitoxin [Nitrospiraceae bacterium]